MVAIAGGLRFETRGLIQLRTALQPGTTQRPPPTMHPAGAFAPTLLARCSLAAHPVDEEMHRLWGGLVAMIVDAYFNKRMAW